MLEKLSPNEIPLTGTSEDLRRIKLGMRDMKTRHGIVYKGHDYSLDTTKAASLASVNDAHGVTELIALAVAGNTMTGFVVHSTGEAINKIEAVVLPVGEHRWDNRNNRNGQPLQYVADKDMTARSKGRGQWVTVGSADIPDRALEEKSFDLLITDAGEIRIQANRESTQPISVIDAETLNQPGLSADASSRITSLVELFAGQPQLWEPTLIGQKVRALDLDRPYFP